MLIDLILSASTRTKTIVTVNIHYDQNRGHYSYDDQDHDHCSHDDQDQPGRREDRIVAKLITGTPRQWNWVRTIRYQAENDVANNDVEEGGDK